MITSQKNSSSKIVHIGVDPSKHSSGIAIKVDGELAWWDFLPVWDCMRVLKFRQFLHSKDWINPNNDVRISCEVSGHGTFSNFDVNRAGGMVIAYIMSVGLTTGPMQDRVKFWYPQQWRKRVFGTASKEKLGITDWKLAACRYASETYGVNVYDADDVAEAICLVDLCKEQNETKVQKTRTKRQSRMAKAA